MQIQTTNTNPCRTVSVLFLWPLKSIEPCGRAAETTIFSERNSKSKLFFQISYKPMLTYVDKKNIFPIQYHSPVSSYPYMPTEIRQKQEINQSRQESPFLVRCPRARAEQVFSSCVRTGCNTWRAPCRWHTSDRAAESSGVRRECRDSWLPWTAHQAPGPGPCRTNKHNKVKTLSKIIWEVNTHVFGLVIKKWCDK